MCFLSAAKTFEEKRKKKNANANASPLLNK